MDFKIPQIGSLPLQKEVPVIKGNESPKEIEKAARDFEGMLLKQMLDSMWQSVPKNGFFRGKGGSDNTEQIFHDMLNEAIAKSLSEGQGIGIRDIVKRELEKS
jgi:flagellar protein FlgJ